MKSFLSMRMLLLFLVVGSFLLGHVDSFAVVVTSRTATTTTTTTTLHALEVDATLEVVNGHGSIGSMFLQEDGAIAVPRGVAPGCLSQSGSPIVVANVDWTSSIVDMTPNNRQSDLVWVVGGNVNSGLVADNPVMTTKTTTTTTSSSVYYYVYGKKHAAAIKTILTKRQEGAVVSVVESWTELLLQEQQSAEDDTSQSDTTTTTKKKTKLLVPIPTIDLVCYGEDRIKRGSNSDSIIQSAIVVGGGIIGSSIARALSQRGIQQVTVYDPTPIGKTTPASWAWLNANQKPPQSYKSLNQLGLRGWRSDVLLKSLQSLKWTGTLVRTKEKLELSGGGYTAEGPLSPERIRELEPEANFTTTHTTTGDDGGYVYYFADEGHVNPQEAVLALRQEARDNGVSFVSDECVVGLVRNKEDGSRVIGVKTRALGDAAASETEQMADVVIVAAGANSSDQALGGVPLVHNPSRTYFASPCWNSSSSLSSPTFLNRTLMDMVTGLYVAQRKDGTFVAGGGALKFGLSSTTYKSTSDKLSPPEAVQDQMAEAQAIAQQLAPNPVGNSNFTHKEEAIKPMPKDGFPILGYLEEGLYCAVTHSGMTMAPLIGQLVAAEVKEQVSLSILDDYRPSRFDDKELVVK